jgi:hypothetical protein
MLLAPRSAVVVRSGPVDARVHSSKLLRIAEPIGLLPVANEDDV